MKSSKVYFLLNSIAVERGGLTRACFKQASVFAEKGYDVSILTFVYNELLPQIRQELYERKMVHKKVKIVNLYEDLQGYKRPPIFKGKKILANLDKLKGKGDIDKRKGHNAYRVITNGYYEKYLALNDDDTLKFIDHFGENRQRTKRVIYDVYQRPARVIYMSLATNKPTQDIYFDEHGKAYLSMWYNEKKGKHDRVYILNKKNKIEHLLVNGLDELKVYWLQKYLQDEKQPIVITDTRSTDETLMKAKLPNAIKLWRLHSHHHGPPYKDDSDIADHVKTAMTDIDAFDGLLFLTEQQRQDFTKQYGHKDKSFVIPHYHETKAKGAVDPSRAIIISRLSTLKQVEHSVRAFEKVVSAVPHARLDIYGRGTEKKKLAKLIQQLNLTDYVTLKGYTKDADQEYARSLFSICTSKSEGFSLAILESLANGAPVISYDIKYGPSELIEDGKTGYLIPKDDIDGLADRMIELFTNERKTKQMSKRAKSSIEKKFSKKIYFKKWLDAIQQVMKQKKQ